MSTTGAGTVLFVTYGNGHIAKVAPVVRALDARGIHSVVLALTLGYKQAQRMGLSPLGYRDFLHLVDRERVLELGAPLVGDNSHPDVDPFETQCYLGINYADWVDRLGAGEAARRYAAQGRRGFLPLNFIGRMIDDVKPDLVVSTASPRSEQAAIEAAKTRGIPTMTMMDLLGPPSGEPQPGTVFADRITVLSQLAKDNLLAAGVDASRISVTGCPAYDGLFEPQEVQAAAQFIKDRNWEGLKVVLWAGILEEPADNVPPEYLGTGLGLLVERQLRAWVESRPDVAVIVRYHPTQYHLFERLGSHPRVYVSNPIADRLPPQLHACDCVITQMSTVGFEGVLLGKRLLALSFSPMVHNFDFDYGKLGLGESIPSLRDLIPILDQPASSPGNPDALPPKGPATPRVLALALSLMAH